VLLTTINDPNGYPVSCAVDPTTGNIAVMNIFDTSGAGAIYIYTCPSCTPTTLTILNFYNYYFGGYDTNGNLFVDGRDASGNFVLGVVPAGSSSGHTIAISGGAVYFPGFVQWYKPSNYLVVDDQLCGNSTTSCLYWVQISGSTGKITGQTTLLNPSGGPICDLVQGVLNPVGEKNVVGGDYNFCGSGASSLDRWLYPAGGVPTNYLNVSASGSVPIGGAISVK
jgi:hypothetical protein